MRNPVFPILEPKSWRSRATRRLAATVATLHLQTKEMRPTQTRTRKADRQRHNDNDNDTDKMECARISFKSRNSAHAICLCGSAARIANHPLTNTACDSKHKVQLNEDRNLASAKKNVSQTACSIKHIFSHTVGVFK